jgi:hypothetical protein
MRFKLKKLRRRRKNKFILVENLSYNILLVLGTHLSRRHCSMQKS